MAEEETHISNTSYDDDDGDEFVTAQKVLDYLEMAWRNEMCAPDILSNQNDMVELMFGQISHMEENMKDLDKNDFRFVVHQMELERIRYVIASYLRCRVKKIELYTQHILNEEQQRSNEHKKLSHDELKFAEEYLENIDEYMEQVALRYMPNMQPGEVNKRVGRPNIMSHVFVKANVSVPSVVVGVDDEEVDLSTGSQHIIPYKLISDLIEKSQVHLI